MMMVATFCSHTMRQKSTTVCSSGPCEEMYCCCALCPWTDGRTDVRREGGREGNLRGHFTGIIELPNLNETPIKLLTGTYYCMLSIPVLITSMLDSLR